jgi:hypothetical protein
MRTHDPSVHRLTPYYERTTDYATASFFNQIHVLLVDAQGDEFFYRGKMLATKNFWSKFLIYYNLLLLLHYYLSCSLVSF